jgi:hypothetical protein
VCLIEDTNFLSLWNPTSPTTDARRALPQHLSHFHGVSRAGGAKRQLSLYATMTAVSGFSVFLSSKKFGNHTALRITHFLTFTSERETFPIMSFTPNPKALKLRQKTQNHE